MPHALLTDHFWSLCIEEQFYLIWPAIVWLVRSRRALLTICSVGIIASVLLRLYILHAHPEQLTAYGLYFPTYIRCGSLFAGGALAMLIRSPINLRIPIARRITS